jgi:hypothetical protein
MVQCEYLCLFTLRVKTDLGSKSFRRSRCCCDGRANETSDVELVELKFLSFLKCFLCQFSLSCGLARYWSVFGTAL